MASWHIVGKYFFFVVCDNLNKPRLIYTFWITLEIKQKFGILMKIYFASKCAILTISMFLVAAESSLTAAICANLYKANNNT